MKFNSNKMSTGTHALTILTPEHEKQGVQEGQLLRRTPRLGKQGRTPGQGSKYRRKESLEKGTPGQDKKALKTVEGDPGQRDVLRGSRNLRGYLQWLEWPIILNIVVLTHKAISKRGQL